MPPIPVARSATGIAKETTPGTPVAPTHYIPYTDDPEPRDVIAPLDDLGIRGSMVDSYGSVPGVKHSTHRLNGNVHPDVFPFVVASLLPDWATTGASAPYTHTGAAKNSGDAQPTTYTLTTYDGTNARAFPYMKATSLEMSYEADALATFSSEWIGAPSVAASAPTPSYTAVDPMAVWMLTATVGGSTGNIESASLSITRDVTPIHTADGTQDPYSIFAGPIAVEGSLTRVFTSETELDLFRNWTKNALVLSLQTGSGASLVQVQFTLSKTSYREAGKVRGSSWVEVEYAIKGEANTTDVGASGGWSPIKAQIKNAVASGVYV